MEKVERGAKERWGVVEIRGAQEVAALNQRLAKEIASGN